MTIQNTAWKRIFPVCLALFAATAICMKWMEGRFLSNGELFSILGLEITYPAPRISAVLTGLEEPARTLLLYHLRFDFVFMAGVYPGIAALCMMARGKFRGKLFRNILLVLAGLQLVAWGCDIIENMYLLRWLKNPSKIDGYFYFHMVVWIKWGLALSGFAVSIPFQWRQTPAMRQG
ncbi:MAG: hypothetical protein ACO25B_05550 [Chitinophagaceae bacterium]